MVHALAAAGLSGVPIASETKAGEAEQHHGPGRRLGNHGAAKRERRVEVGALVRPTMSVPTRSQSGSSAASRVQLCRSVKADGNGVPGATIGFGADSHKKSPSSQLDLGHEEIMIGGRSEGVGEGYVELHFSRP